MRRKLQHLTIVSMAVRSKRLPYDELLAELGVQSVRELEDLLIDAIYADIMHGKLDQCKRQLEVDWAIGRDVRPADIGQIAETLQQWSAACETVLQCIEQQIVRANDKKAVILQNRTEIDSEVGAQLGATARCQVSTSAQSLVSSPLSPDRFVTSKSRCAPSRTTTRRWRPSARRAWKCASVCPSVNRDQSRPR